MKNIFVPCLVSLIIGVGMLVSGIHSAREAKRSESWPSVEGQILKSTVEAKRTERDAENSHAGTSYFPSILYTYTVAGTPYKSSRIAFISRGYAFRNRASNAAAKYPVGKRVQVFYDASSPTQAALEPGTEVMHYAFPVLGVFFILAAVIMFIVGRQLLLS